MPEDIFDPAVEVIEALQDVILADLDVLDKAPLLGSVNHGWKARGAVPAEGQRRGREVGVSIRKATPKEIGTPGLPC